jgi:hypothetical protein
VKADEDRGTVPREEAKVITKLHGVVAGTGVSPSAGTVGPTAVAST